MQFSEQVSVVELDECPPLTSLLARGDDPVCFWGPDAGVVGWGEAARFEGRSWDDALAWADGAPEPSQALGPVGVVTLTFDPERTEATSVLVVPRQAVVRRHGRAWLVTVGDAPATLPEPRSKRRSPLVEAAGEDDAGVAFRASVTEALAVIESGDADKLVMAARLRLSGEELVAADLAADLAHHNPGAWVYCVDGLVGASPEMLLRRSATDVTSLVLAGTIDRRLPEAETLVTEQFRPGAKDYREHLLAAESAREAFGEVGSDVTCGDPFVLRLPHVIHLATEVRAHVPADLPLGAVLGRLHPTAAVGGVPREGARARIRELEGFDRARFAGPVGMVWPDGSGEFAIALRGGQITPSHTAIDLYAGAGIVQGSEPDAEWREVLAKLRPMRDVLGA